MKLALPQKEFDRYFAKLKGRQYRSEEPDRAILKRKRSWLAQQRALRKEPSGAPQGSPSPSAKSASGQAIGPSISVSRDDWFAEIDQDEDFWNLVTL